jgi:4-amino-4-deoxy-L-arabinose transferase-like glycosyltransferase
MLGLQQTPVSSRKKVSAAWPVLLVVFLTTAAILFLVVPKLDTAFAYRYSAHFEDGYYLIANNLAHGNGYRLDANMGETMIREPGYPLFLAALFKVAGYHLEAARFANWLLAIGIAIMIMRLTRIVTGDARTALIASVLFLLHPGTIICEARGGVEVFCIFAILVFMLLLGWAVKKGGHWRYLVVGLALGIVVQIRSTPMVFPVFLLFYLCLIADSAPERLRVVSNVAILVLGMVVVMTPWTIRNYLLVHEFVPTATIQGLALQEGQYACQNFSSGKNYYVLQTEAGQERDQLAARLGIRAGIEYYQEFVDPRDEWRLNNTLLQGAKAEYLRHPALFAKCVAWNAVNFWFLGKTWVVTSLNMLIQIPVLILTLSGLYLLHKRGLLHKMGIMLTFVLSVMAVHLAIAAEARYSIPLIAFLAIPASVAVMSIWQKCWVSARTGTALSASAVRGARL